jgi:arginase family enzyme
MKVLTFEEHSSVLAMWWGLGSHPRTLVYLDAHLDLQQLAKAAEPPRGKNHGAAAG